MLFLQNLLILMKKKSKKIGTKKSRFRDQTKKKNANQIVNVKTIGT